MLIFCHTLWENIRNKNLGKAVLKWNENTLNLWPCCKYFGELKRLKLRDNSVNVKSSVFKISEINIKILSYILDHCEESFIIWKVFHWHSIFLCKSHFWVLITVVSIVVNVVSVFGNNFISHYKEQTANYRSVRYYHNMNWVIWDSFSRLYFVMLNVSESEQNFVMLVYFAK